MSLKNSNIQEVMNLEIAKMLTVSTCHITKRDDEILASDQCPVCCYPLEAVGYLVYAYSEHCPESDECALSEELLRIMKLAVENGCDYVRLDCDGSVVDELPTFEW